MKRNNASYWLSNFICIGGYCYGNRTDVSRNSKFLGNVLTGIAGGSGEIKVNQITEGGLDAEWDVRRVKVKTKVSGCYRCMEGKQEDLAIISYIGTAC